MANITNVQRFRVLLRMLHPDPVDAAWFASPNVMVDLPLAAKYGNPICDIYNMPQLYEEDGVTPREATAEEKATFVNNVLRRRIQQIREESEALPAGPTAVEDAKAVIGTEFNTDLGGDL